MSVRDLANLLPAVQVQKLPRHVRQEKPLRCDDIAVLRVADCNVPLKWSTGCQFNISLIVHGKGQFTAVAQHNARLAHPAVQLQMCAGQKAFFRQIHTLLICFCIKSLNGIQ